MMRGSARRMPLSGVLVQLVMLTFVLPGLGVLVGRRTLDRTTGWRVERMQARVQAVDEAINAGHTRPELQMDDDFAEQRYKLDGHTVARDLYALESVDAAGRPRYRLLVREYYGHGGVIARDLLGHGDTVEKRRE